MNVYVVLLCVVNVGGIGKLLMCELVVMCKDVGFFDICIYIVSGNVVFCSGFDEVVVWEVFV